LNAATGGYGYDRQIIAGLRELGWRVTVHALDESFPFPTAASLHQARTAFAQLQDDACVLVDGLAFGAMPEVLAAHAERLRLVALVHHPLAAETGLSRDAALALDRSERESLRFARHVVVTSEVTAAAVTGFGVDRARISVVVPGTEEAPLAPAQMEGNVIRLLCVATLTPRKGHDLLFEALSTLREVSWKLVCVGSLTRGGPTVEALQRRLREAALEDRIELVGELRSGALTDAYMASDLFVLATRHEGYCMAVAEAIAHGLPVISTHTGAIPDLVGAEAGLIVPPDDGDAFRDALGRVLNDRALFESLRGGARRMRARVPRWHQSCIKMAQLLEQVRAS
jgi:glycosyltransferase involved in cell wall biosynthesis